MSQPIRFSIGDMLLATLLAALPLACVRWTGEFTAFCLSLMSIALTFGYGQVSLALMCVGLSASAILNSQQTSLGAFAISVALTVVIAMVLRFFPKRQV